MKSYIRGNYAHTDCLLKILANDQKRKMLKALLDSYPTSMKVKDIASKGKVKEKTAYGYLNELKGHGLIKQVDEREETGGSPKFVIENVNNNTIRYIENNTHRDAYSLAPGNVEYSREFKDALNRLTNQLEIETQCNSLLEFVKNIVESVDETLAPAEDHDSICSLCGLNHEGRDFIRATLLYLLDQFEISSDYLRLLREHNYVDKNHFDDFYHKAMQDRRKSEREQHNTIHASQEILRLRIISIGRENYFYTSVTSTDNVGGYFTCLAINKEDGLIPVALHKSVITNVVKVDTVIECVPSAILNNTVFLARENPHLQVLADDESIHKLTGIQRARIKNISPGRGGMTIIPGIIEAQVVSTHDGNENELEYQDGLEEPKSRLLINDETGEAELVFKADFASQIESVNGYPWQKVGEPASPLVAGDRIKIIGATSLYDEAHRLTIELQPYSTVSVLKNGIFKAISLEKLGYEGV